jgi:hypothetical protein
MRTALPVCVLLAVFVALPVSASAKQPRSASAKRAFQLIHPCPSTGVTKGACPGYIKDHVVPLACGGPDVPSNMQWQTKAEAKAKDRWETKGCAR